MILASNVNVGLFAGSISASNVSGNFLSLDPTEKCELLHAGARVPAVRDSEEPIAALFTLLVMKGVLIGAFPENSLKHHTT